MIIKKIVLDNIRSYEHEEIELNAGSTLLAGDIGSGKTSVLLGIEFGLFGLQPGQRGSSLLRNGKNFGGVKLEFEIDSKNILIERTLKRGKTVSQDYSAITINGKKNELAVTELKQRVLNLLNYPTEFSKKQNILYKFTVYTPQEEMKQIILEDPQTRVNTLRHVFGIDKYKTILENTSIVRLKLREEKRLMEGITINLEKDKEDISKKEIDLKKMKDSTTSLSTNLLLKIEKRKNKEREMEEIQNKIKEKNNLREELVKSKIMLSNKKEKFSNNEKFISEIKNEIEEFKNLKFNELQFEQIEQEIFQKEKLNKKQNEILINIASEIATLKNKQEDSKKIQEKMSNLEVCPTCYQNVDAIYRANIMNKSHNQINQSKNKIEELEIEKNNVIGKIDKLKLEISKKEKQMTDLKILKMKFERIKEKENKLKIIMKENLALEKDIFILNKHLETINDSILEFSKYDLLYKEKETELKIILRDERIADIKLAEIKKEIEVFSKTIIELKNKIEKVEKIKIKLNYISELEMFLNKKFIPVISFIEKNVMVSLKYEFSKLFSEWFNILVPENFEVKLIDDFTPLIEQKDYEIDYAYLSGGERTAIALAYRLALNQVINSLMSKIKTRDLVILDEPTDGFSDQQLDKMREVLEQLNIGQLIIVSHEQKIEGFVENVIKFRKERGISSKE